MDGGAPALPPNDSKADGSVMPISQKATATPTSKPKALGNKEGQKPGAHRVPAPVCLDNPNLVIDGMTQQEGIGAEDCRFHRPPLPPTAATTDRRFHRPPLPPTAASTDRRFRRRRFHRTR